MSIFDFLKKENTKTLKEKISKLENELNLLQNKYSKLEYDNNRLHESYKILEREVQGYILQINKFKVNNQNFQPYEKISTLPPFDLQEGEVNISTNDALTNLPYESVNNCLNCSKNANKPYLTTLCPYCNQYYCERHLSGHIKKNHHEGNAKYYPDDYGGRISYPKK